MNKKTKTLYAFLGVAAVILVIAVGVNVSITGRTVSSASYYCCGASESNMKITTDYSLCSSVQWIWGKFSGYPDSCYHTSCTDWCTREGYDTGAVSEDKLSCVCSTSAKEGTSTEGQLSEGGTICIDTDGGLNPDVYGTASAGSSAKSDVCYLKSEDREPITCSGADCYLKEYYCSSNTMIDEMIYPTPIGCESGVRIVAATMGPGPEMATENVTNAHTMPTPWGCVDTDSWSTEPYLTPGNCSDASGYTYTDYCSGDYFVEYSCGDNGFCIESPILCSDCEVDETGAAACLQTVVGAKQIVGGNEEQAVGCEDTDGEDYYTLGQVTDANGNVLGTDSCYWNEDGETYPIANCYSESGQCGVTEQVCTDNTANQIQQSCTACADGACLTQENIFARVWSKISSMFS